MSIVQDIAWQPSYYGSEKRKMHMLQKDVDDVHAFANITMKAILSIKAMKNWKARIHMI